MAVFGLAVLAGRAVLPGLAGLAGLAEPPWLAGLALLARWLGWLASWLLRNATADGFDGARIYGLNGKNDFSVFEHGTETKQTQPSNTLRAKTSEFFQ